jgi:hypothetical protein
MSDTDYHKRPEWSYSQMKLICEHGIDYAVAVKRGDLLQTFGKAVDIGQIAHNILLGGDYDFVVKAYPDFRTKEAREWRDAQVLPIISQEEFETASTIVDRIKSHKLAYALLTEGKQEVELFATINGINIRGKADSLIYGEDGKVQKIIDLKTTAKFDEFRYKSFRNHYDLQSAVYTAIAGNKELTNYYFVIAETIEPYRVQIAHASLAFIESGENKLSKCISEITKFGDRGVNFNIEEIIELGDLSNG